MSLTEEIKEKAHRLGFDKVGATPATPSDEGRHLIRWLREGRHGTMEWMARNVEHRLDPHALLPGAQTILCVAANYYTGEHPAEEAEGFGKISRYAWGRDYHDVLLRRLRELLAFIEGASGARGKVYVDTGPLLEKVYAQKAGIGWQGKHSNVITRELGSWVFLGEAVLDIPLEYDLPAQDFCGTCTLCIDACPTGAIVEPYVVDSRRCISYLTIELRGAVPASYRPQTGSWVYGCDICQEVCPWNRFARPTRDEAFLPGPLGAAPPLETLAQLDEDGFRNAFRGSAVKRTKRRGLLRNTAIALGNRGGPETRATLESLTHDPDPLVREHAEASLQRLAMRSGAEPSV